MKNFNLRKEVFIIEVSKNNTTKYEEAIISGFADSYSVNLDREAGIAVITAYVKRDRVCDGGLFEDTYREFLEEDCSTHYIYECIGYYNCDNTGELMQSTRLYKQ